MSSNFSFSSSSCLSLYLQLNLDTKQSWTVNPHSKLLVRTTKERERERERANAQTHLHTKRKERKQRLRATKVGLCSWKAKFNWWPVEKWPVQTSLSFSRQNIETSNWRHKGPLMKWTHALIRKRSGDSITWLIPIRTHHLPTGTALTDRSNEFTQLIHHSMTYEERERESEFNNKPVSLKGTNNTSLRISLQPLTQFENFDTLIAKCKVCQRNLNYNPTELYCNHTHAHSTAAKVVVDLNTSKSKHIFHSAHLVQP